MEILAVGELANQFINDPVRFWGAPLLYGGQPPDFFVRANRITMQIRKTSCRITTRLIYVIIYLHRMEQAFDSPEPNSHLVQHKLY